MIILTLIAAGSVLTVIGWLFPVLDNFLPTQLSRFWFWVRADDWSSLAATSVRRFVTLTERLSNFTASGARSLLVSVPIVLAAIWTAAQLASPAALETSTQDPFASLSDLSAQLPLLGASGFALLALFLVKLSQGPVMKFVDATVNDRRRAAIEFERRRLDFTRRRLEADIQTAEADEDIPDHFLAFLRDRLLWTVERDRRLLEELERMPTVKLEDALDEGMGSVFRIFIISAAAFATYIWAFMGVVGPVLSTALFDSGPIAGFQAVIYMMLPILVIFIFLQSIVPTSMILLNPKRLKSNAHQNSRGSSSGQQDPLGQGSIFLFLLGAALSLLLTYGAFLLGHSFDPAAYVPQTLQMILANALFDGLTFTATLLLMRQVDRFNGWVAFLVLIVLIGVDLVVAGLLAFGSLFAGLMGSAHALDVQGLTAVLLGQPPDASTHALGPLFWVMHTAFLPTGIYLFFIAFWALAKVIMSIALAISQRAASRGLMATGGMLIALATIWQLAGQLLAHLSVQGLPQ
jgi:hypothetical protein